MSISYVQNIPNPTHTPANDVSNMQLNNNHNSDIWNTDHVGFNTGSVSVPSGSHNKITLPQAQVDPGPSGTQTIIYPKAFNGYLEPYAASCVASANQIRGYIPFVKCICSFTGIGSPFGAITADATYITANVGSINQADATHITLTFAQQLPTASYYVFTNSPTTSLGFSVVITKAADKITFTVPLLGGTLVGSLIQIMVI
jgi:hypothetical protein